MSQSEILKLPPSWTRMNDVFGWVVIVNIKCQSEILKFSPSWTRMNDLFTWAVLVNIKMQNLLIFSIHRQAGWLSSPKILTLIDHCPERKSTSVADTSSIQLFCQYGRRKPRQITSEVKKPILSFPRMYCAVIELNDFPLSSVFLSASWMIYCQSRSINPLDLLFKTSSFAPPTLHGERTNFCEEQSWTHWNLGGWNGVLPAFITRLLCLIVAALEASISCSGRAHHHDRVRCPKACWASGQKCVRVRALARSQWTLLEPLDDTTAGFHIVCCGVRVAFISRGVLSTIKWPGSTLRQRPWHQNSLFYCFFCWIYLSSVESSFIYSFIYSIQTLTSTRRRIHHEEFRAAFLSSVLPTRWEPKCAHKSLKNLATSVVYHIPHILHILHVLWSKNDAVSTYFLADFVHQNVEDDSFWRMPMLFRREWVVKIIQSHTSNTIRSVWIMCIFPLLTNFQSFMMHEDSPFLFLQAFAWTCWRALYYAILKTETEIHALFWNYCFLYVEANQFAAVDLDCIILF